MNRYAYQTTSIVIKALSEISKAKIVIHGQENIPENAAIVFAINHFTRIETLLIPYHIHRIIKQPIWSLADYSLFEGALGSFLNNVGAVSTKNPDRDLFIVKSLLSGEASWIIFPEGRMVKNKKVYSKKRKKDKYVVGSSHGIDSPHSGAAALALRTAFYRERLRILVKENPDETKRLMDIFQLDSLEKTFSVKTYIVPVNLTYYPIRARENVLNRLAEIFINDMPKRISEEIMTEGTMLLSGVDVDMRFAEPISIAQYMKSQLIRKDISSPHPINFDDDIPSIHMMKAAAHNIMMRYMSSIYNLTTVNHDHIFASLIKQLPFGEINEKDLKLRAYLAASRGLGRLKIKKHESLFVNQISLLTDDRYNKFSNFLALAIEKNVLEKHNSTLIRENSFSGDEEFHKIRLDNPVAVIANEVEPLTDFQEHIRRLAWQPGLRIKYMTAKYLQEKALFSFEKDYANFSIPGESKSRNVGRPILIKGGSSEVGIVLIHGYMAAPVEVKAFAQFLASKGYWVYAPRLAGHGTSPEDLASRGYMEWVESVEEGYAIIRNTCKNVVIGGFSTGAGLALDLCTRVKDVAGVFSISPPLKLQNISTRIVPAVNLWNKIMKKMSFESAQKEFVQNEPENPHINYSRNPISGIMELERLMDSIEPKLSEIKVPALIIQSQEDPVVNPEGSRKIFELLGSEDKEYLLVNFPRHGIINGDKAFRIYKAVNDFLRRLFET